VFPDEVIQCTLIYKKGNTDGLLVSINVLKFITVIINYCASLHLITTTNITEDLHPVHLNITGNQPHLQKIQDWTIACSFLLLAPYQLSTKHKFPMDQH
jgi:hypothetical protein